MPSEHSRSPTRLLAPTALAAVTVAILAILVGSGAGEGDGAPERQAETTREQRTTDTAARPRRRSRAVYVVKTGDTLGEIAQKTGVEVERLQVLNPELDPQALVSGQKIKLRE